MIQLRQHKTTIAICTTVMLSGLLLQFIPNSSLCFLLLLFSLLSALYFKIPKIWAGLCFAVTLGIWIPLAGFSNSFLLEVATQAGIFAALALGLNIVVGMAGLLDLGFSAFFAIGAYTWAIFGSTQAAEFLPGTFPLHGVAFYPFLIVAIVTASLAGIIVGLPALRLRGDYLAIVTLGLGEVVRVLANNLDQPINITNGPKGITPISRPPVTWITNIIPNETLSYSLFFYVLVLLLIGCIILVSLRLEDSKYGRAWVAIRENEIAARAMGVPLLKSKLIAFATGAGFSGIMGAIYAAKQTFVSPESFTLLQSITILSMVILGGMGSVAGAVLGAVVVTVLNIDMLKSASDAISTFRQSGHIFQLFGSTFDPANIPAALEPAKYERMIFGLLLILMMIFRPNGLLPYARRKK